MSSKLQIEKHGDMLTGYEYSIIADNHSEAIELYNEYFGYESDDENYVQWMNYWIGSPVELTEENIDDFGIDGFDVGDTVYHSIEGSGRLPRELKEGEILCWQTGPWTPHWSITSPIPDDNVWVVHIEREVFGRYATEEEAKAARDLEVTRRSEEWKTEVALQEKK